MKEDELFRLAFLFAEAYQESLACAYRNQDDDEPKRAMALVKAFRKYRVNRWGRTKEEQMFDEMKPISIAEIAGRENT